MHVEKKDDDSNKDPSNVNQSSTSATDAFDALAPVNKEVILPENQGANPTKVIDAASLSIRGEHDTSNKNHVTVESESDSHSETALMQQTTDNKYNPEENGFQIV